MLAIDRHEKIMQLLVKNKSISVKTLCDLLQASEATIRRDLTLLENENKLERTHGGAFINDSIKLTYEETFNQKELIASDEKRRIAQRAFEMIKANDSLVLDSGTTTLELARLIGESDIPLMVITNATTISNIISKNEKVEFYVLGGRVRLNTLATVGSMAIEMLKRYNVSKAFVGVNGITIENGLTTPDLEEAEIKKTMLSIAEERIVLTDSSKFQKVARCQITPLSMVDKIITDVPSNEFQSTEFTFAKQRNGSFTAAVLPWGIAIPNPNAVLYSASRRRTVFLYSSTLLILPSFIAKPAKCSITSSLVFCVTSKSINDSLIIIFFYLLL